MKIYKYKNAIHCDYKTTKELYVNERNKNKELWYCEEYYSFAIGIDKKLFEKIDVYYDGQTIKGYTILGITFFKAYSYNANNIDNWEDYNDEN
jgi:hypothetical protein